MFNTIKQDHKAKIEACVENLKVIIAKAKETTEAEMEALESQIQHLLNKRVELKSRLYYIESKQKLFQEV